jgi:hypothetical protein
MIYDSADHACPHAARRHHETDLLTTHFLRLLWLVARFSGARKEMTPDAIFVSFGVRRERSDCPRREAISQIVLATVAS